MKNKARRLPLSSTWLRRSSSLKIHPGVLRPLIRAVTCFTAYWGPTPRTVTPSSTALLAPPKSSPRPHPPVIYHVSRPPDPSALLQGSTVSDRACRPSAVKITTDSAVNLYSTALFLFLASGVSAAKPTRISQLERNSSAPKPLPGLQTQFVPRVSH